MIPHQREENGGLKRSSDLSKVTYEANGQVEIGTQLIPNSHGNVLKNAHATQEKRDGTPFQILPSGRYLILDKVSIIDKCVLQILD